MFIEKAESYFETANSDSITYHDKSVNELLSIASKIEPSLIPLYWNNHLNENHKLVLLHILDRLEYKWQNTRKEIPYSISDIRKVYQSALETKNESLRFQAIKCSQIAKNIAKEFKDFGDTFYKILFDLLNDDSKRIRVTVLFHLSCNIPDSISRPLPNVKPLKKILSRGESEEIFQVLQYLRGDQIVHDELRTELRTFLRKYDGKNKLFYIEVLTKYLIKQEILDFTKKSIQLNTIYSVSSVLELVSLQVYPEIKSLCENQFEKWYDKYPELRTRITEISVQLDISLKSLQENEIIKLPENEFLAIVSNKKVEGTLIRILKLFQSNSILISRGDGGFEIVSALSYYTMDEILELKLSLPENVLNELYYYCKKKW